MQWIVHTLPGGNVWEELTSEHNNLLLSVASEDESLLTSIEAAADRAGMTISRLPVAE
jgi:hypothetical protein